jgi:cytochrome c553
METGGGAFRGGWLLAALALALAAAAAAGGPEHGPGAAAGGPEHGPGAAAAGGPGGGTGAAAAGGPGGGPGAAAAEDALAEVLARDGSPARGKAAYATCAVCHLETGAGRSDGTFPRIAGQHERVLVKQLVDVREGRRANPVMKPHADALLDAQEIADVAAFVAALPPPSEVGRGEGSDLARGESLYRRDCAACHGERGQGDGDSFVPMLAGQHYAYLLRQIRAIGAGRRGNAHPVMEALAARYTDAELRAVVDYAGRLPGAGD